MIDITTNTGCVLVYATFKDNSNAEDVVQAVLEKRYAACANIYNGVASHFIWDNIVQSQPEVVVIFKTTADKQAELYSEVKRLSVYQTPCLISYNIESGEKSFIDWIKSSIN